MKNGDQWQAMVSAFEAYVQRTGNGSVPAQYPENPRLGRWVAMMRYRRKIGELDPAFISELDRKGFCWSAGDQRWETMFKELLAFRRRHGHCEVPTNRAKHPELGAWVASQRHWHKRGTLSDDRTRRLDEIGFRWQVYGRKDDGQAEPKRVEKSPKPIVKAPPEERLYHIGADGYVQYDGVGEMPAELQRCLKRRDDWPPYIPLPAEPTRFMLGGHSGTKVSRIAWKGHGPLPADIIQYVKENGCLPPQG